MYYSFAQMNPLFLFVWRRAKEPSLASHWHTFYEKHFKNNTLIKSKTFHDEITFIVEEIKVSMNRIQMCSVSPGTVIIGLVKMRTGQDPLMMTFEPMIFLRRRQKDDHGNEKVHDPSATLYHLTTDGFGLSTSPF